ncbi:MAG: tetratricopeptide repeat protein [Leptolyngbya sp. SIO1E4]|nr:tetratricopeptide repeat protein [Leptolyngbya sp. SIO1E4]
MSMSIRQFEPSRAVEVIAPRYGSGYCIGGRLVLTAAHLLGDVGSSCTVRAKQSFGEKAAHTIWKAKNLDIALIELPSEVERVEATVLGKLPKANTSEKLDFQMYAYPRWGRTQRDAGKTAAGGRQIEGVIYLADTSPDGLLVLEPQRLPTAVTTVQSEWEGASGAAIVCDGLVIAVQSQHQNPKRPASLEASPLWTVYDDKQWQQLLERHGIKPEMEVAHLRESLPRSPFSAASFHFSTYRPETWTGREDALFELTQALQNGSCLLLIHGMTGIGKTTLAERLAAEFAMPETYYVVAFDQGDHSKSFSRGALAILQTLGDDTAQQLPDEQLLPHLLQTLEQHPCWLQLDSVEYLLSQNDDGESHFSDLTWLDFFYQFLTQSSNARIVLTSQALPTDLVNRCLRYDNLWQDFSLAGLERDLWLALFNNYGVTPQTDQDTQHLYSIADYFEGHPLILKMIAGDIGKRPFNGDVSKYWQEYYSQRQNQLPPKLRQSQEQRARSWVNQTIQSLPDLPRQMLQHCAVFRRPVPETFYRVMLPELTPNDADSTLMMLKNRNLVEDHDLLAGQFWLRQHNLIREVAYANLKRDRSVWEAAERQAAHLWLNSYVPAPDALNIESVRGYLEAFDHYCEIEDWEEACAVLDTQIDSPTKEALHWQLETWGYYQDEIRLYERVLGQTSTERDILWHRGFGLAYSRLGDFANATRYLQGGLQLAKNIADKASESKILGNLGTVYLFKGQYEQAINYYLQDLEIAREIGDRRGESYALGNLGIAYKNLGQYEQAINYYQQPLVIARETGDRYSESLALGNLGIAYESQGNFDQAIKNFQQWLIIAREIGNRKGESSALGSIGSAYINLGQYELAIDYCQQSLTINHEICDRRGEGLNLGNLGIAYTNLREYDQAFDYANQHLAVAREIGDRRGEGAGLRELGVTLLRQESIAEALENLEAALNIFQEVKSRHDEAEALKNLGELYQVLGEIDVARQYAQQALALATELDISLKDECLGLMEKLETGGG